MITNVTSMTNNQAMNILKCIGEINDLFIEEAESLTLPQRVSKRLMRYGTIAAAASVGLAVTYWYVRSKRTA